MFGASFSAGEGGEGHVGLRIRGLTEERVLEITDRDAREQMFGALAAVAILERRPRPAAGDDPLVADKG